jgi:FMN-dependent NADH-azoreductase
VTLYDLWSLKLPSLEPGMIEARYDLIAGTPVPPQSEEAWTGIRNLAEDFLGHDAYLVSTPMWNFGIPYRLKHFIDVITHPGMMFRNDARGNVEGMAAGRRALIIAASAMPFGQDETLASLDFQSAYLEKWMQFIGITQIEILNVSPTFGSEEVVNEAMGAAEDRAAEFARNWVVG